uniref:Uncharacterized protein n=1 Tax=Plectus sambesii TaxID=2011161 RepID=A0A914UQX5_9BILA
MGVIESVGGGKEQGTMVAARIESYVPEYILYHDPVRFGSEHFFGVPVKLTYSADHRGVKLESKLPSQKAMRKFAKRKNKNPLKTRITVKELKKIVEHHKQSMQANRPITPGLPAPNDILHRAMTVVNISATDVFSSHEPHLEEYSTGDGALLAMPMTFRPRKDL